MFRSAPPRGRRQPSKDFNGHAERFDPRPRAGGDFAKRRAVQGGVVSIRAPAREATGRLAKVDGTRRFRSAPPRGRRPGKQAASKPCSRFDPRPRAGGDNANPNCCPQRCVSIRAPAREATSSSSPMNSLGCGFDPRPRAGGDDLQEPGRRLTGKFRSAPPRGRRRPMR